MIDENSTYEFVIHNSLNGDVIEVRNVIIGYKYTIIYSFTLTVIIQKNSNPKRERSNHSLIYLL